MAEAVGIGVGVLSFAIQIADSLIKLKNFADSMKSAPDELRRLISGIEEVERILKIVESKDKELGGHAGRHDKLSPSVDNCRQAARRLAEITQKIEKTLLQKPKRGRFQYASSQKSLEAASRQLEVEKATLNVFLSTQTNILAEKVYCQQVSTLVHVQELKEHIERKIESSSSAMADIIRQEISQQVTSLNVDGALTRTSTRPPSSKSTRIRTQELPSALGYIFGAINYSRTKSYHDSKVGTVEELTVRLTTPSWLFGKVYEAHKIQDSWSCKFALRSHNILPPSHAVFRYSEEGNIRGLKQLFSSGRATPFDRDDRGRTPLHVSSSCNFWGYAGSKFQFHACQFLVQNGADRLATDVDKRYVDNWYRFLSPDMLKEWSPPLNQAIGPRNCVNASKFLRLYSTDDLDEISMEAFDFSTWNSYSWFLYLGVNPEMVNLVIQQAWTPPSEVAEYIKRYVKASLAIGDLVGPKTIRLYLARISIDKSFFDAYLVLNILYGLADSRYGPANMEMFQVWYELLTDAIRLGVCLHPRAFASKANTYRSFTYLSFSLCCYRGLQRKSALKRVLECLVSAGLDLLAFSEDEMKVLGKSDRTITGYDWKVEVWVRYWNPGAGLSPVYVKSFGFNYGATIEEWDWWHIEAAYYEYAEDFWHMIESPWEQLPGA